MPRREDHEVHKDTGQKKNLCIYISFWKQFQPLYIAGKAGDERRNAFGLSCAMLSEVKHNGKWISWRSLVESVIGNLIKISSVSMCRRLRCKYDTCIWCIFATLYCEFAKTACRKCVTPKRPARYLLLSERQTKVKIYWKTYVFGRSVLYLHFPIIWQEVKP